MMNTGELPEELMIDEKGDWIMLSINDVRTNWISISDSFFERISNDKLNRFFKIRHLTREIEVKNTLDKGIDFLNSKRYVTAVECFDEVLYYDGGYPEALINKSHALFKQGHFVKSLRFYKKAIRSGYGEDIEYYKLLLNKSGEERDAFPKIKKNIYAGDEAVSRGEFVQALEFYQKALENPSKFKDKILFRLLNKKALILIELENFDEALTSFEESINAQENDLAYFGKGFCEYKLGMDCIGSLKRASIVDKKFLLKKAHIFNDLGCYEEALDDFNEFLNNHFVLDSSFKSSLGGKVIALDNLGLDSSFEKDILSKL